MAAIGPEGAVLRGEPPGGSTEAAMAAPGANIGAMAFGMGMALDWPGAIMPIGWGLPSAGVTQSSCMLAGLAPGGDPFGERRVAGDPRLGLGALAPGEHAQRVFGGERLEAGQFGGLAHRSRHRLSWARPRRIQLFTVPSGASMRRARAS